MVDLSWNQSEDEVVGNSRDFINSEDIPEGTYVIKFGGLRESTKLTGKGIPYYWLDCEIVSDGPYKTQHLDQIICGPPDPNAHNYEDWMKFHNVSRGKVNRWVKAMGISAISNMSELEGNVLQVEWRMDKKGMYKEFGHIQNPPPKSEFKQAAPQAAPQPVEPAPARTSADQW